MKIEIVYFNYYKSQMDILETGETNCVGFKLIKLMITKNKIFVILDWDYYLLIELYFRIRESSVELRQNFTVIQDIDSSAQKLKHNIEKLIFDYISNSKEYTTKKKCNFY